MSGSPGPSSGLALLIRERLRELGMTIGDLERATGLPHATVYAYARGDILGARINNAVREKLAKLAKALNLTTEQLIAAARDGEPDYEAQMLRLFRQLGSDVERRRALFVLQQFVGAGRRRR